MVTYSSFREEEKRMNRFFTVILLSLATIVASAQFSAYGHSPDWQGDLLVTTVGESVAEEQIALWSPKSESPKIIGFGRNARFSPSGNLLAFERDTRGKIVITNLNGKVIGFVVVQNLRGQFSWISQTEILFPRTIYSGFGQSYDSLWVFNIASRNYQEVWSFQRGTGPIDVEAIDGNPNSWFTTSYTSSHKMAVWASVGHWQLDGISGNLAGPRFLPGAGMGYLLHRKSPTWGESGISVLDLTTLESRRVADGYSACWSPDGKTIAVAGSWNDRIRFVPNPF